MQVIFYISHNSLKKVNFYLTIVVASLIINGVVSIFCNWRERSGLSDGHTV